MMENTHKQEIKPLEIEVKEFANAGPYWKKYLCSKILVGNEITNEIIDVTYSYLLEELGLKEKTERPELFIANSSVFDGFKENLSFDSLTNVKGVNALAENQTIELSPKLTIIYGANGSGKSGYVRLLKKCFYSKI